MVVPIVCVCVLAIKMFTAAASFGKVHNRSAFGRFPPKTHNA